MIEIKVGLPRASGNLVKEKSLYNISKISDNLTIKLYYKSYCSILRRVIREAKIYIFFKHLLETSENKTKTMHSRLNQHLNTNNILAMEQLWNFKSVTIQIGMSKV
jgi:homoaconitase/3-isopropylmalate dehydratase large subunit